MMCQSERKLYLDGTILLFLKLYGGIISLPNPSLIPSVLWNSCNETHLSSAKRQTVQMNLPVSPEIIAKSPSLLRSGRARLTYGAIDSLIILPLQSEINLILSVRSLLSALI